MVLMLTTRMFKATKIMMMMIIIMIKMMMMVVVVVNIETKVKSMISGCDSEDVIWSSFRSKSLTSSS